MSDLPELPAGYREIPFAPGLTEIANSRLPFFLLLFLAGLGATFVVAGLAIAVGTFVWLGSRSLEPVLVTTLLVAVSLVALGVALIVRVLIEKTWIVGNGTVAQRDRFRLRGGSRLLEFSGVRGFEIVHRVWQTGRGSSDELVLLLEDARRIEVLEVENRPKKWRSDESAGIEPVLHQLGQYLAWRSALPLTIRDWGIQEPDADGA